jgi:mycofactocin precursor
MPDRALQAIATSDVPHETERSAPGRPEAAVTDEQRTELVEADLLIEDVSIDGMCGVY